MYMAFLGSRSVLLITLIFFVLQFTSHSFAGVSATETPDLDTSINPMGAQTTLEDQCDAELSLETQRIQELCLGACDTTRASDVTLSCDAVMLQCMDENGMQAAKRAHEDCKREQADAQKRCFKPSECYGSEPQINHETTGGTGITAPVAGGGAGGGQGEEAGGGGGSGGEEPPQSGSNPGFSKEALASEVSQCNRGSQEAFKCCNAPEQCGVASGSSGYTLPPTNDPEGMKRYCEQMKYSANRGRNSNADAAAVCYSKHSSCSSSCKNSKEKWENYLPNCRAPNCDPAQVQQALEIFSMKVRECNGLQENERLLATQSTSNYNDALIAQQCAQQSSMDLSSLAPQNQGQNPSGLGIDCSGENANRPECIDCSKFPNSPACGGGNQNSLNNDYQSNPITSSSGEGLSTSDFNVSGDEGLSQLPQFAPIEPTEARGTAVKNGGGGGLPGSPASSGSGFEETEDGAVTASSGYSTDILSGERGGGGYSGAAGEGGEGVSGGGGFGGYGRGGSDNKFKNKFSGLDLKQYLPGGAKDPSRDLTGTKLNFRHPEIGPMGVSMFKKISDRFTAMCKLKQLYGCD